jgi:hypothetical protein
MPVPQDAQTRVVASAADHVAAIRYWDSSEGAVEGEERGSLYYF